MSAKHTRPSVIPIASVLPLNRSLLTTCVPSKMMRCVCKPYFQFFLNCLAISSFFCFAIASSAAAETDEDGEEEEEEEEEGKEETVCG